MTFKLIDFENWKRFFLTLIFHCLLVSLINQIVDF